MTGIEVFCYQRALAQHGYALSVCTAGKRIAVTITDRDQKRAYCGVIADSKTVNEFLTRKIKKLKNFS